MNGPAPAQDLLGAAVDWQVRLTSGSASPGERADFARWLSADPLHAAAWQRVQGVLAEPVARIRDIDQRSPGQLPAVHRSLTGMEGTAVARPRRRIVGGSALALLASVGAGYLVHRSQPLPGLLADVHTGTGQMRRLVLPDGSGLTLNARSAADVRFGPGQRLVYLQAGELLVQVAREAMARPFAVQNRHGSTQALGTRFLVREEGDRSLVVALEHGVALATGGDGGRGGMQHTLAGGQAAWMDGRTIVLAERSMAHRAGWTEGVLDVRDEPLGEVIEALRPWRAGLIRISPAAARLRVFGVFRLDDVPQALQALVDTQPITVTTYGPALTMIDVA